MVNPTLLTNIKWLKAPGAAVFAGPSSTGRIRRAKKYKANRVNCLSTPSTALRVYNSLPPSPARHGRADYGRQDGGTSSMGWMKN